MKTQLYTSLVRAKQALNGGVLPPMTPIPGAVQHVIDAALTLGLGSLDEDADKGLRCPVRGCGGYFHNLTQHVNRSHPELGGALGLKGILSIPPGAPLASSRFRESMRAAALRRPDFAVAERAMTAGAAAKSPTRRRAGAAAAVAACASVNRANLRDRCEAQVGHKLIDLHNELGREPTQADGIRKYGAGFAVAVKTLYGTWLNALNQQGLEIHRRGRRFTRAEIQEALRVFYEEHGRLPSRREANSKNTLPILPPASAIIAVYGMRRVRHGVHEPKSWEETMERLAVAFVGFGQPCPRIGPSGASITRRDAESALNAWRSAHGRLPTSREVRAGNASPPLPRLRQITAAFGVSTWSAVVAAAECPAARGCGA